MYPEFTVEEIDEKEDCVNGTLSRLVQGKENWIDDRYVGVLVQGNNVAFGRWSKSDKSWKFKFDQNEFQKLNLSIAEKLYAIDSYWGERAEIILDKSIIWKEVFFKEQGNFTHDHCAICWAVISEVENTNYHQGSGHPVCNDCYRNYVAQSSLAFIPSA